MPLLNDSTVRGLLEDAAEFTVVCPECGQGALDYCRSCDRFYRLHEPRCSRYEDEHSGHRLTIVPFVEVR